jgi:Anti-sigma factor NepR
MTIKRPPKGDAMPFITAGDWSVGFNSPTSLGQAELLGLLGRRLRESYEPVVREPLPEQLGALVDELERQSNDRG